MLLNGPVTVNCYAANISDIVFDYLRNNSPASFNGGYGNKNQRFGCDMTRRSEALALGQGIQMWQA